MIVDNDGKIDMFNPGVPGFIKITNNDEKLSDIRRFQQLLANTIMDWHNIHVPSRQFIIRYRPFISSWRVLHCDGWEQGKIDLFPISEPQELKEMYDLLRSTYKEENNALHYEDRFRVRIKPSGNDLDASKAI